MEFIKQPTIKKEESQIKDGKVCYESRGGNVKNEWSFGHTLATPPSLEKFAEAVVEKI